MVNSRKLSTQAALLLIALWLAPLGCTTASLPDKLENGSPVATPPTLEFRKEVNRQQGSFDAASVFAPILPSLRGKTKVPLKFPRYLAMENETNALFAIIELTSPSAYEIQLAFTQDCSGGNACHYGIVSGRNLRLGDRQPKGKPVPLTNGLVGYFVDATCGAVCSDSTLTWNEDGYRYTVGLKAESLESLKKVAVSAIVK